jgi:hypothetical protein
MDEAQASTIIIIGEARASITIIINKARVISIITMRLKPLP